MIGNFFRGIAKTLSAVVIFATFLAYLCPQVNPRVFPWLSFFGTAFPWFMLLNLLFVGLWSWRLDRFALYHFLILALGWQYISSFIGMDIGAKPAATEQTITVATHNIGGILSGVTKITEAIREKKAQEYARFLQENGYPDLLCTQEIGSKFTKAIANKMNYPYTFKLIKSTAIFSRYPIEAGGDIPFAKTNNSTTWADVRIGERLIRIYAVHLQSNRVTSDTEKVIDDAELTEENTWDDIGAILGKVGRATSMRAQQAELLREHIKACPHPVLVCGDFNDTPNSYVYRILSEGLIDTFKEKGTGLGSTFAGSLPLLRIDYILADPRLKVFDGRRVKKPMSDHYPVMAEIEILGY